MYEEITNRDKDSTKRIQKKAKEGEMKADWAETIGRTEGRRI